MSAEAQIKEKLGDKMRRLTSGKLYKIKNKAGQIVPFVPNSFQLDFLNNKHSRNIIVKARQLGFSTMIDIDYFDDFLFRKGFTCGIIADREDTAKDIFRDKIQTARDNLPAWLKQYYKVNTSRANEISLENTGSRIYVATGRGTTAQRLHISEFGKICNMYPAKAQEIVTGAIETVGLGNEITIESTAMGAEGYFYDFAKQGKELQEQTKTLNELDWKLFFYPWWQEKGYSLDGNILIQQDVQEYLSELESKLNVRLTQGQKNWYYMKRRNLTEQMFQEYPSDFNEAFNLSIKGAYFEKELTNARLQKRIGNILYNNQLLVNTAWDLGGAGGGDDTAIWFYQTYANEVRIIDHRSGNGRSMLEIIETIIKTKPYKYGIHYGPHDLSVVEYSTGTSRRESAKNAGFVFETVPRMSISEGINLIRQTFPRIRIDEQKCKKGIDNLGKYRRAWDEKNGIFLDRPQHNGSSHDADALRYLCTAYQNSIANEEESIIQSINR